MQGRMYQHAVVDPRPTQNPSGHPLAGSGAPSSCSARRDRSAKRWGCAWARSAKHAADLLDHALGHSMRPELLSAYRGSKSPWTMVSFGGIGPYPQVVCSKPLLTVRDERRDSAKEVRGFSAVLVGPALEHLPQPRLLVSSDGRMETLKFTDRKNK